RPGIDRLQPLLARRQYPHFDSAGHRRRGRYRIPAVRSHPDTERRYRGRDRPGRLRHRLHHRKAFRMDTLTRRLTRAAVWSADGVRVRDVELPTPGPGELLVRVDLATVCGSDLHTVSGRRPAPSPSILGHEAVGHVAAAGPGAERKIGERIVWSVTATCGRCGRCRRGFTAKCEQVRKVGHEAFTGAWPLSGGYGANR